MINKILLNPASYCLLFTHRRKKAPKKGFSLIEILLALSITAILSISCLKMINLSIQQKLKLQEKIQHIESINDLWTIISLDTSNSYKKNSFSIGKRKDPMDVLIDKKNLSTPPGRYFSFFRYPPNSDLNKGIIEQITYTFEEKEFIRTSVSSINSSINTVEKISLFSEIQDLKFEIFSPLKKEWLLSRVRNSDFNALKVKILMADGILYERIFLLSQS